MLVAGSLLLLQAAIGQDSAQSRANTDNYNQFLLQKSSKLEKAGWIVFGAGIAICTIAFLIPKGEYRESRSIIGVDDFIGRSYSNSELRTAVFWGGTFCLGYSFILFGKSTMTKKRALSGY